MTTTSTPAHNTTRLANLATRLADAQARKDELTAPLDAQIEELKAAIRDELATEGPGTFTAGDHSITLRPNRRFDPMEALRVLPETIVQTITTTTIDTALAKKRLSPDMYEACMTERGNPVVIVK